MRNFRCEFVRNSIKALPVMALLGATACVEESGYAEPVEPVASSEPSSEQIGSIEQMSGSGVDICETGDEQTPIALSGLLSLPLDLLPPSFNYEATPLSMRNTGTTVEFAYEPGSYISKGGTNYQLAQFHFHTPSEHTINGNSYPLEMHLVHVDSNGNPALVVGVMIQQGSTNAALSTAFANLPDEANEVIEPTGSFIDANDLLPSNRTYFRYDGSLTTPPCSEGIDWYVMSNPIQMSSTQISAYQNLPGLFPSNRELQPRNGRVILKHLDLL